MKAVEIFMIRKSFTRNSSEAIRKEAEEFISKHGMIIKTKSGYFQQVPQVSISQTSLKLLLKFAVEFGLTPSARSRIIADNGSPDSDDPMEWILYEGGKNK